MKLTFLATRSLAQQIEPKVANNNSSLKGNRRIATFSRAMMEMLYCLVAAEDQAIEHFRAFTEKMGLRGSRGLKVNYSGGRKEARKNLELDATQIMFLN